MSSSPERVVALCINKKYTSGEERRCSICDGEIWLSYSTVEAIIEQRPDLAGDRKGWDAFDYIKSIIDTVCISCGAKDQSVKENLLSLGTKQKEEIMDAILKDRNQKN